MANYRFKVITREQMNIIILGIEQGLTIEKCCSYMLHIASRCFYRYATDEQKTEIKNYKKARLEFFNSSHRSSEIFYNRKYKLNIENHYDKL